MSRGDAFLQSNYFSDKGSKICSDRSGIDLMYTNFIAYPGTVYRNTPEGSCEKLK